MTRAHPFLAALLVAAGSTRALARPLSLAEATAMALERNPALAIQKEDETIASASAEKARGGYDPSFKFDLGYRDRTDASNFIFSGAPPGALGPSSAGLEGKAAFSTTFSTGGTLGVTTSVSRDTTDNIFTLLTPSYSTFAGVDFRQPLLKNRSIDGTRLQIRIADADLARSRAATTAAIADTVASVERAYWTLVAGRRDVEVREQAVALALDQRKETEARVDAGYLAKSDLAAPEAEIERRKGELYASRGAAVRAELQLKSLLLGDPADPLWSDAIEPSDPAETEIAPVDLAADVAAAQRRPEIAVAEARLAERKIETEGAKNRVLPQLDLVASYGLHGLAGTTNPDLATIPTFPVVIPPDVQGGLGRSYGTLGDASFPEATIGLSLTLPIRNRAAEADAAASEAELRRASLGLVQEQQRAGLEVRSAAVEVDSAAQRIEAAQAGAKAAEVQLQAERDRFAAGLSTNFVVLTRQNDLAQARLAVIAALTDYRKAATELAHRAGRLLDDRRITVEGDAR